MEDTVEAVARFHAAHEAEASPFQRVLERITRHAARPTFIALLTALVLGWILLNLGLMEVGRTPLDRPPFFWLQGAVTCTALYMTVLILTTQRREDKLAGLRDQLTARALNSKRAKIREDHRALGRAAPRRSKHFGQAG